jgi:hypothetical protein
MTVKEWAKMINGSEYLDADLDMLSREMKKDGIKGNAP